MIKITGKQCKAARSLLKWNLNDLCHRCGLPPRRVESFERGVLHLQTHENDDLVKLFKGEGIEFKGDLEVKLGSKGGIGSQGSGVGQQVKVDAQTMNVVDSEAENPYASHVSDADIQDKQSG